MSLTSILTSLLISLICTLSTVVRRRHSVKCISVCRCAPYSNELLYKLKDSSSLYVTNYLMLWVTLEDCLLVDIIILFNIATVCHTK
jgi:hypothetical protein